MKSDPKRLYILIGLVALLGMAPSLFAADEACDGLDNDEDALLDEGCLARCDEADGSTTAFRLTTRNLPVSLPEAVWNGSEYATVWHEGYTGSREVWFRRWDRFGGGLGSSVNVSNAAGESSFPSVMWTGSHYVIAWEDDRDGNDEIYTRILDSDGQPTAAPTRLTNTGLPSQDPSIAYNLDLNRYGIAYLEGGNVVVRVGQFTGTISSPTSPKDPDITWAGNEFGVTWSDRISNNTDIYFHRVSGTNGAPISGHVRLTAATTAEVTPSIAWTGSQYVVAWSGGVGAASSRIFHRRIGPAGEIGSGYGFVTGVSYLGDAHVPSVVATGSQFAIAWEDDFDDTNDYELFVRTFEESGDVAGDSIQVTSTAPTAFAANPSLVWTGAELAVAFTDNRVSDSEVWLERLGCCNDYDDDGYTSCEGDSINLSASENPGAVEVCDGLDNNTDGTDDEVCSSSCGATNDPPERAPAREVIGEPAFDSRLIWTGSEYLALAPGRLRRLAADGTPLGPVVDLGAFVPTDNAIWNGGELAGLSGSPGSYTFYRFDRFGNLLSAEPVTFFPAGVVSLAWNGSEYMAVYRCNGCFDLIYALRFDALGNLIGPAVYTGLTSVSGYAPAVTWNGSAWIVAYVRGGPQLLVNRLRYDGTVVPNDAALETITTGLEAYARDLELFQADGGLALVWRYHNGSTGAGLGVRLARLTNAGALIVGGMTNVADQNGAQEASAVWTGEEYAVVWAMNTSPDDIAYFQRVASDGITVGSRLPMTPSSHEGSRRPSVDWSGRTYGVLYGGDALDFREVICCNIDVDGDGSGQCDDCDDEDPAYQGMDEDGDGVSDCAGDCDDAVETCIDDCTTDTDGDATPDCADSCEDADGDGRGVAGIAGDSCLGADCSDADINNWNSCASCADSDGDGVFGNCDQYATLPGPDCNDADINNWASCGSCVDGDEDAYFVGCDQYVTITGPDCNDLNAVTFPGGSEICDGEDNDCDALVPADEIDGDGDGFAACAGDCAPADMTTYPGAPEINDTLDNQCIGDPGFGVIDEISGELEVPPGGTLSWPAQQGADLYQIVRATSSDFVENCTTFTSLTPTFQDTQAPGQVYYYLVRPLFPNAGSWGQEADGSERVVPCAG